MTNGRTLRRLALQLDGTTEAPHFDRMAFKVARTYVTLAADGLSANFRFTPDEQALKCTLLPSAFSPVANAWGAQGWTVGVLAAMTDDDLKAALELAWQHARPRPKARRKPKAV
ncbi:MmcQ/YjbR family DNA-binding protein [Rhodopseudomonas telluris]|uniref:MmcQ/YjbR family DNA-binding protein n=1 Tax=Rhodopseudomonas telluris TaxID=644215 RepID=A0ABV6EQL5_9BRAD